MTDLGRHEVPDGVETAGWTLGVTGTVDRPIDLARSDLDSFPAETFTGDLVCEEEWIAEDLAWRGVRVGRVLSVPAPRTRASTDWSARWTATT